MLRPFPYRKENDKIRYRIPDFVVFPGTFCVVCAISCAYFNTRCSGRQRVADLQVFCYDSIFYYVGLLIVSVKSQDGFGPWPMTWAPSGLGQSHGHLQALANHMGAFRPWPIAWAPFRPRPIAWAPSDLGLSPLMLRGKAYIVIWRNHQDIYTLECRLLSGTT